MLTGSQIAINELQGDVDRLTPLAKAEHLAEVAAIENHWKGSTAELDRAQKALTSALDAQEAETFATDVQRVREARTRRFELSQQLATLDEKVAGFSEERREYFRAANDVARWTDAAAGLLPVYAAAQGGLSLQRDAFNRVLDVSPRDKHDRPIVADDAWEAVKELREIYKERAIVGQSLSTVDAALRDMFARNPALSKVQASRPVLAASVA